MKQTTLSKFMHNWVTQPGNPFWRECDCCGSIREIENKDKARDEWKKLHPFYQDGITR